MSAQQDRKDIGTRVYEAMNAQNRGDRTQGSIAESLGFTPDAFFRSVNGERAFTTGELARVADAFNADLHYLITGEPDPLRVVIAARHDYDHDTSQYSNAGRERDKTTRDGVLLAYRQATPWLTPSDVALPTTAAACRDALGDGFATDFANRVEYRLGIDIGRLPGLSTDYFMTLGHQQIVQLATAANWFRSNWSLAHELGHLRLGHHDVDGTHADTHAETAANAFAADRDTDGSAEGLVVAL